MEIDMLVTEKTHTIDKGMTVMLHGDRDQRWKTYWSLSATVDPGVRELEVGDRVRVTITVLPAVAEVERTIEEAERGEVDTAIGAVS